MKKILLFIALITSLFSFAQNVGVGTATPANKLHVHSGTSSDVSIGITNSLTTDGALRGARLRQGDNDFSINNYEPTGKISLVTNNFERLIVTPGGNVGIGANIPSQKLDVNGNINVSGNIQVNNVAGQPNQVLMTNNSGNTFWGDMSEFKNFTYPGNSWTVPAGVTKIWIEAWGAGGGGAAGGGGSGGKYVSSLYNVTAGQVLTCTYGFGGAGAITIAGFAGDGTVTSVVCAGIVGVNALGGTGAGPDGPGRDNSSTAQSGTGMIGNFVLGGQPGKPSSEIYSTRSTNGTTIQYVTSIYFGNGGGSYRLYDGPTGGFFSYNTVTSANIKINEPAFVSPVGTGGAGGVSVGGSAWGGYGGSGFIIIHW